MAVSDATIYEFAGFRLIPKDHLLLRMGESVPLPPKAFSTLVLLLENSGHLVNKEELIEKIWADAVVEEAAVSRCVWTIRNALGETSKSQRFIQTVPRKGYRFVAPVNVLHAPPDISNRFETISTRSRASDANEVGNVGGDSTDSIITADATGEVIEDFKPANRLPHPLKTTIYSPISQQGLFQRRHLFAISVILLIAAGVFAAYISYPWTPTNGDGRAVKIAVLPFQPVNSSEGDQLYGLGIADALINRLSPAENLEVRSLSSVRRYVDLDIDATAAGNEQKVEYVLASNYQLADGKVRITAQLIDVAARRTVEAFDFLKDAPDAFTAQNAVAAELKERLSVRLGTDRIGPGPERGTNNDEAYRYYLLAQNFNELRGPENGQLALERVEQALALDPNFARAWATKAYIHRYIGYGPDATEHSLKSIEAVEKALALDPNLPEAHSVRCFNKFRYEYDFAGAETACKRALELDPNSALAHKLYGNFLYTRGRFNEAITEIKKAIDLQPVSYDNQQTYALALYFARKYADSETQWKQLIPMNPNHSLIYRQLVSSLVWQGKEQEAFQHLIKLLTLEKESDETMRRFRKSFAKWGWRGVTLERIRLAESRGNARPYELARLYATINDNDNAFKYLDRAYQERSTLIPVLGVDPELEPLRNDPRYIELLQRVEQLHGS